MQRVVIYRLGSLGDTVVALPCFHRIAERFPDAERIVLTNHPVAAQAPPLDAVLGGSGLVHRTIAYPVGLRSPGALIALRRSLAGLGADTMIYLGPGRTALDVARDRVFFRLCGFRRVIGMSLARDIRRNRIDPATRMMERECERLARALAALGPIDVAARAGWDLRLGAAERRLGAAATAPLGGRFVAINMGGKLAKNDWGVANWRQLLAAITAAYPGLGLLVVGGPEDGVRAVEMVRLWQGPVVDGCGRLAPRVSAAALADAALFVGHDSGPLHLAAAAGVRCVGLFGDNNPPRKWHPPGDDHIILHRMAGVMSIAVAEVVEAVRRAMPVEAVGA